jgi:hypothetical protein
MPFTRRKLPGFSCDTNSTSFMNVQSLGLLSSTKRTIHAPLSATSNAISSRRNYHCFPQYANSKNFFFSFTRFRHIFRINVGLYYEPGKEHARISPSTSCICVYCFFRLCFQHHVFTFPPKTFDTHSPAIALPIYQGF